MTDSTTRFIAADPSQSTASDIWEPVVIGAETDFPRSRTAAFARCHRPHRTAGSYRSSESLCARHGPGAGDRGPSFGAQARRADAAISPQCHRSRLLHRRRRSSRRAETTTANSSATTSGISRPGAVVAYENPSRKTSRVAHLLKRAGCCGCSTCTSSRTRRRPVS